MNSRRTTLPRKLRLWAYATSAFMVISGAFLIDFAPAKHHPDVFRLAGAIDILIAVFGMALLRFWTTNS